MDIQAPNLPLSDGTGGATVYVSVAEKYDLSPDARDRRIDKAKGKVQVVGFDGTNQDGVDDDDVFPTHWRPRSCLFPSSAFNLGADDTALDYRQPMGLVYPADPAWMQHPYTHVNPTQILAEARYLSFHTSPSSDGWDSEVHSSSNASPERYNVSNASTLPSAGGAPSARPAPAAGRKYIPLKQGAQDAHKPLGQGPPRALRRLTSQWRSTV
ncbi:hypothetical protein DFH09DRAFT_570684 [Mycena vulgaris]|nr:hypothetical protein DFH09DRAFT_570684 [Mycena vulgaris]